MRSNERDRKRERERERERRERERERERGGGQRYRDRQRQRQRQRETETDRQTDSDEDGGDPNPPTHQLLNAFNPVKYLKFTSSQIRYVKRSSVRHYTTSLTSYSMCTFDQSPCPGYN